MRRSFRILPSKFKQTRSSVLRGEGHGGTGAGVGIGAWWSTAGRRLQDWIIRLRGQRQADEIEGDTNWRTEGIQKFFDVFKLLNYFSYMNRTKMQRHFDVASSINKYIMTVQRWKSKYKLVAQLSSTKYSWIRTYARILPVYTRVRFVRTFTTHWFTQWPSELF